MTDDGQRRSERARTATFYPDYYNSNCGSGCWRTGGNSFTDFFFFFFLFNELEFDVFEVGFTNRDDAFERTRENAS